MSRPRTEPRDTAGHLPGCARPFVAWRQWAGNEIGCCETCGAVFTRRSVPAGVGVDQ